MGGTIIVKDHSDHKKVVMAPTERERERWQASVGV